MRVQDERMALDLDLAPYQYKLVRAADFFAHMHQRMASWPGITHKQGQVGMIRDAAEGASVTIDGDIHHARYVFNSIVTGDAEFEAWMRGADPPTVPRKHHLLQHFLGWVIETNPPVFSDGMAQLMDFRLPQHDETRFVYVLPFDARRALVEFTVFGPKLLVREEYERELRGYISAHVSQHHYAITHTEFGVIPMTDAPIPAPAGKHIINIGTAGGASKPSTGYTFVRIQRQCAAIVQALAQGRPPALTHSQGFLLLDRTLLNVLAKNRVAGSEVFMRLFARNPAARVLAFLDEAATLPQTLALMRTVQLAPFTRALLRTL
jgi:lycopene beta-cyclase